MVYLNAHVATSPCGPALERMREVQEHLPQHLPYAPIYDLLGADPKDTFAFTASGAEAINQVHWTAFIEKARKEGKCHFITSAVEDAATMQSLKRLEEFGCFVKIAPLDASGQIDVARLAELISPRTALISISLANGFTGVVQPIQEIAKLAEEKGVWLHADATYALGKIATPFQGLDYLTFSGDRLHSVQGSGGLFAKAGRPLVPFILGKELDRPSLMALSAAASQSALFLDTMNLEVARLRDSLEERILREIPEANVLFQNSLRLPNVSAISFPGAHPESLLYLLQRKNIFASILGEPLAMSFSLSRYTTQEDIDRAVPVIVEMAAQLCSLSQELV